MQISIPGEDQPLVIETVILDLNGTLTIDGKVVEGVAERIQELRKKALRLLVLTGDSRGNGEQVARDLGLEIHTTDRAEDKARIAVQELNPETCAAIGNGRIDGEIFNRVRLAIAVLQAEGLHIEALRHADVLVPSIDDALDLFLKTDRLSATLQGNMPARSNGHTNGSELPSPTSNREITMGPSNELIGSYHKQLNALKRDEPVHYIYTSSDLLDDEWEAVRTRCEKLGVNIRTLVNSHSANAH